MKTVFCPLCKAPLQVVFKMETVRGWKRCQKCGKPSYIVVAESGDASTASLHEIVALLPKSGREALAYLLKKGKPPLRDVIFIVGKAAERDLENLYNMHVLDKDGEDYFILPALVEYVRQELGP